MSPLQDWIWLLRDPTGAKQLIDVLVQEDRWVFHRPRNSLVPPRFLAGTATHDSSQAWEATRSFLDDVAGCTWGMLMKLVHQ